MLSAQRFSYTIVDAFTARPFGGNPAAVMTLAAWPSDAWLQLVAREMNLSETAFLVREGEEWRLRWFTPAVEVDLCGHATLASAKVLWELGLSNDATLRFMTRSGLLSAERAGNMIAMDFPVKRQQAAAPPADLLPALGIEQATHVGRNEYDYLVALDSPAAVRKLSPDFTRLARVAARGIIVTAPSDDSRYDFISRFFAPAAGVNEDPVTGSAHCCLVDYWAKRSGKSDFSAYQASTRGGELQVGLRGDRVRLAGQAVIVSHGELQECVAPT